MEKNYTINKWTKIAMGTCAMLVCTLSFGQEYAIKKNGIFFQKEKTAVATFTGSKSELTFVDQSNSPLFSLKNAKESTKDGATHYWVTLTNLKTNESNDVGVSSLEYFKNIEKQALNFTTVRQPQIITKLGINEEILNGYIQGKKMNYAEHISKINDSIAGLMKQGYQTLKDRNIKVEKDNTITEDGSDIGVFVLEETKTQIGYDYAYYLYTGTGNDKMLYAAWIGGTGYANKDFTPYTAVNNTFYYLKAFDNMTWNIKEVKLEQKSKDLSKDPFAREILAALYGAGYNLANGKVEINEYIAKVKQKKQDRAAQVEDAHNGFQGFVITPTGEKIEGKIQIDDNRNASFRNPGELGNIAKVTYKDASGAEQILLLKAEDDGYILTLNVLGHINTYKGLDVEYGNMLTLSSLASKLTVGGKTFYHRLYEDEVGEVYYYQNRKDDFVLKLKSKEKGLYLKETNNKKKLHKAIRNYLQCETIDLDDIKEQSLEGMKEILLRYKKSCQ